MKDESEKPIYFTSRALSKAERNYAQIEREGLAVIFGVSKFHKYIYGWEFTIIKDHKPLLGLFKENRAISPTGSPRVQHWALVLASYHNQLVYKPGSKISNADGLSRLPIEDYVMPLLCPEEVVLTMSALDVTLVTSVSFVFSHQETPCYHKCVNGSCMDGWKKDLLIFNHTQSGRMSNQNNWVVFYGDHGWLSQQSVEMLYWKNYMRVIQEFLGWSL